MELELRRIRELSMDGRFHEALTAAEALAVKASQNRDVLYLIAANQRCLKQTNEALDTLARLEQQHPRFSLLYQERGHCYFVLKDVRRAISAFAHAVNLNAALVKSWAMLEGLYRMTGDSVKAAMAAEQVSTLRGLPPEVVRAGSLFSDGDLSAAEKILRDYLIHENHVEASRLLARIARQYQSLEEAESLLEAAVKVAPEHRGARLEYFQILLDQQKYLQMDTAIKPLLQAEPDDRDILSLYAAAYAGLGRHEAAIETYRALLATPPKLPGLQVALGHSLQSMGRQQEAINCFREAAVLKPNFGDAYWSLANLKTYHFEPDEIAQMRSAEAAPDTSLIDRYHLCFALGKAYEDRKEFAESWQFYQRGNALKRGESRYRPEITEANTRKQVEACTAKFFAARVGVGAPDFGPIFIVGLPRSGSTLIEQILASHSQVDGTGELPEIPRIVRRMEGPRPHPIHPRYPDCLEDLPLEEFQKLGESYLRETRAYRGDKQLFLDKMPNNFRHIGLIHLILPNAKIIDVRREPMACCFGNLKQLFASGQEFAYSIEDIARYYRTYLELMRHWDTVLPGKVLRVCYEDVVEDLEQSVRRILEFCGLKFESTCVEFYKLERSVSTASSEQVRQPIFREGLQQWKNYKSWLGPLKDGLDDAMVCYRD
jgi:tetratricopeptide (TPR) repeat protein